MRRDDAELWEIIQNLRQALRLAVRVSGVTHMHQDWKTVPGGLIDGICPGIINAELLKIRMQFDPFETVLCRIAERPLYIREIRMQGP